MDFKNERVMSLSPSTTILELTIPLGSKILFRGKKNKANGFEGFETRAIVEDIKLEGYTTLKAMSNKYVHINATFFWVVHI